MWRNVHGREREMFLKRAIEFTGNAELYGSYMMRIIDEWPLSCEHNLSCTEMNRQAWIGHAACCLATNCPEDITRLAWHYLDLAQQIEANAMADKAIAKWEDRQTNKRDNQVTQLELFK